MKARPPKLVHRFFRWFCREDYLEELEGDLIEVFEKRFEASPARAKRAFIWSVIRYFRPGFIRSFKNVKFLNSTTMFRNNMKVAWRNLRRQPFFTVLNTLGLAIGMAGGLLIALFIQDELSFDKMFPEADRIYRVNIDNTIGGERNRYAAVSGPLAGVMKEDYPHLDLVTRFKNTDSKLIRRVGATKNVKEDHVVGADPAFFEMFGFDLILGNKATALTEAKSVVLTRTAAEKHFGLNEALGQQLILDNDDTYLVTGVIEDFPKNSFLRDHTVLLSISSFDIHDSPAWNHWSFPTFVRLKPGAPESDFQAYLGTVRDRYLIPWAMQFVPGLTIESVKEQEKETGDTMLFDATALTDIHLYSPNLSGEFSINSDVQNVYILSFIGIFLIVLASVNFMNLSTARSLRRSKEVGIRKTLGSHRGALVGQFLSEATLVVFLSMILAVALSMTALPYFNAVAGKSMEMPLLSPVFWIVLLGATLMLGLVSGSYPAFMMSKFSALKSLRGGGEKTVGGARTRSVLVVVQFAISVFLIVGTLVVFQQLRYIQNKDLGFVKDQVLVLNDIGAAGDQADLLKQEVKRLSQVEQVSLSSFLPTPSDRTGTTYFPEGHVAQADYAIIMDQWTVDFDYISTLNLELISGRTFDEALATDSNAVVLNESALIMMGETAESVLGKRITDDFRNESAEDMHFYTVIGVIRNFHFETIRNRIDALSLVIGKEHNRMMIKLGTGDFTETIAGVESIWQEIAPGQPFDYYFMDESFNRVYVAEQRLGSIFITFTTLSIFIACLGLFGLAAFNAERRAKEIGIRKVLGATVGQITVHLSFNFLKLVALALVLALPLAWYVMDLWLQDFSYRVNIPVWVFALAAVMAVSIAMLTLSFQSIKAASASPVKSLRSE